MARRIVREVTHIWVVVDLANATIRPALTSGAYIALTQNICCRVSVYSE